MAKLSREILRAKGVVRFHDADAPEIFQYVPGHHALTPAEEEQDCFLVIIGRDAPRIAGEFRMAIGA